MTALEELEQDIDSLKKESMCFLEYPLINHSLLLTTVY